MKLYFFGDSFTYGHALPDCVVYDPKQKLHLPGQYPSQLGWPKLVSEKLKLEHVNLSRPGMSNLNIHWKLRNTKFDPEDVVIVQWSFPQRCIILDGEIENRDLHVFRNTKQTKQFFRIHTMLDLERRSVLIIEHTELLMKSLGIKYIAFANSRFNAMMDSYYEIADYESSYEVDHALDDMHPGVETNKRWAKRVTQLLKQKFDI